MLENEDLVTVLRREEDGGIRQLTLRGEVGDLGERGDSRW